MKIRGQIEKGPKSENSRKERLHVNFQGIGGHGHMSRPPLTSHHGL